MKKTAIVLLSLILTGYCYADNSSPGTAGKVDFTSHNTDYSILITNNTSEQLVAFKGELKAETLIGGIPAHAKNHGLPKNPALFEKTGGFFLILLIEAQYNAYKSNLGSPRNTPFTRVYISYNKNEDNTTVYEITGYLGGRNTLEVFNSSNILVELRVNGIAGEILGCAPAETITRFNLKDGKYNIFPIFKRYNQFRDTIETVYPKEAGTDNAWFQEFTFSRGNVSGWNLKDILQSTTFTLGVALVGVENQTSGEIRFIEGDNIRKTPSGLENIINGNRSVFQIDMPTVTGDKYADSIEVANWRFGPIGFEVALQTSETDAAPVTKLTIERDKMYIVTVSGSRNNNTLKAYISKIIDFHELGL